MVKCVNLDIILWIASLCTFNCICTVESWLTLGTMVVNYYKKIYFLNLNLYNDIIGFIVFLLMV